MKKISLLLALFALCNMAVLAQSFTVSGIIRDSATGETLVGADVFWADSFEIGSSSNEYGFYSITIPNTGNTKLIFGSVSYEEKVVEINLTQDTRLDIDMKFADEVLDIVKISSESMEEKVNTSQMSVESITIEEAKILPALLGEVDIIKTLQLKPGIQSGGEGTGGIHVRGGGPDQNLILLDEAPIYNAQHLFGFFSTFNSDAVKSAEVYKGGFPARYGGRLSSVIDVKLRDGNSKKFSGSGGLGLISSRLTLEGPIVKDKSSFIVSGRRTYVDIFTRQINKANADNPDAALIPDYYFYDLNGKVNYTLGENDRLFLSGYIGDDVFNFTDDDFNFRFDWGNRTGTMRWNHLFSPKLFSNVSLIYSKYKYKINNQFGDFEFNLGSDVEDWIGKFDLSYFPGGGHNIKYGMDYTYHKFGLARLSFVNVDSSVNFQSGTSLYASDFAAYLSDDWEISPRVTLNGGLRLSGFNQKDQYYWGVEPRFSSKFSVAENVSLKASYSRMRQNVHLVSNSASTLPTDIWYPSTKVVNPEISDQVAAGVTWAINDKWLFQNELYYKWQQNVIDFKNGASLFVNDNLDDEFVFGTGKAYGNEFYLEKVEGKAKGWIGYTLSWTFREFPDYPDINNGEQFHPRYDKRHDISFVGIYELSKRWTFTGAWVYSSGNAVTLPYGRVAFQDVGGTDIQFIVPDYTERNGFRMPDYHRLDLGVVYKMFPKWGESDLTFSTYNTYDRRNTYFLYFDQLEDANDNIIGIKAKNVSLFPIIPSLTWNFKF